MQIFTAKTFCINKNKICEIEAIASLNYKVIPVFTIIGIPAKLARELKVKIKTIFKQLKIKFPEGRITIEFKNQNIDYSRSKLGLITFALVHAFVKGDLSPFDYFYGDLNLDNNLCSDLLPAIFAIENNAKKIASGFCDTKNIFNVLPNNLILFSNCNDFLSIKESTVIAKPKYSFVENLGVTDSLKINQIEGQPFAKRALQIAASGWHNIMIWGPTGKGKTMLAESIYELLPAATELEKFKILKSNHIFDLEDQATLRPIFFANTNTTKAKLFNGIKASINGCVILDELCEWDSTLLLKLKTVIEQRKNLSCPLFIGISNLCPCGKSNGNIIFDTENTDLNYCTCSPGIKARYLNKLSQSFLERFPIQVNMNLFEGTSSGSKNELFELESIRVANKMQATRYLNENFRFNNFVPHDRLNEFFLFSNTAQLLIADLFMKYELSHRLLHNFKRVCRTIADLAEKDRIEEDHVFEAMIYFNLHQSTIS